MINIIVMVFVAVIYLILGVLGVLIFLAVHREYRNKNDSC